MRIAYAFIAFVLVWSPAVLAQSNANGVAAIHTNKPRFRIPFRYDALEMQRLSAREIQLFVSVDRGKRWQHIQSVAPQQGKFEFVAPRNGEYWFSVKTLDTYNQLHPSGPTFEAGLKVVVDTTRPKLSIQLSEVSPGRIQVKWTAEDAALDLSRLKLEFVEPGGSNWQKMAIRAEASGQTSWRVSRAGQVAVRGSVSDMAGNEVQTQQQLHITTAPADAPRPSVPDFRQPIAGQQPPDSFAQHDPTLPPATVGQPVSDNPASRPDLLSGRYPVADETYSPQDSSRRVVNTSQFNIDYTVEDVGPSGVGAVDLYVTQDNGQTWYHYGSDRDRKSPFQVRMTENGEYGFDIRVQSGVGLVADPPQPGDPPVLTVLVDQVAPVARLFPVSQGRGATSNRLQIRWSVRDEYLDERPVALYYSANPNGPWEPITGWQEDTNGYDWTVSGQVPSQLYIRLAARDQAGNITYDQTSKPVLVDLARPTARIINVESADR